MIEKGAELLFWQRRSLFPPPHSHLPTLEKSQDQIASSKGPHCNYTDFQQSETEISGELMNSGNQTNDSISA
jgi:hypothetical protein